MRRHDYLVLFPPNIYNSFMKNFGAERAPGTVELGEPECCALEHAFAKNPKTISELTSFVDMENLELWKDELAETERLVFVPNEKMKTAYSQIAKAELKRLAHEEADFHCGHSPEEHKEALQSVVSIFSNHAN
jgi:hypothetical protein